MRALRLGCGIVVVLAIGCGDDAGRPGGDGGPGGDRDAAMTAGDGGVGGDSGGGAADAGPAVDGAVATDGGPGSPEVCTGGVDEDGDAQTDCADDECWSFDACIAADVAHMVPGLVPCGDPLEVDPAASAAACAMIGTPAMSTYPTDCAAGTLEATGHVYCDASGAAAALWIEERLDTPRTTRMLTARRFEMTYFERASVVDWEEQRSGGSTRTGGTGFPIHERSDYGGPDTTRFRIITVRPVLASDRISRLAGMAQITSIVDLDLPMSMDTRRTLRAGGLAITVPVL